MSLDINRAYTKIYVRVQSFNANRTPHKTIRGSRTASDVPGNSAHDFKNFLLTDFEQGILDPAIYYLQRCNLCLNGAQFLQLGFINSINVAED